MKFKIGDKVKLNKNIKDFRYGRAGVSYEEIGTIIEINKYRYTVDFPSHGPWDGTEEELELVGYTYEVLKKSPIGTKITFETGEVLVKIEENSFENVNRRREIANLYNLKDNYSDLGKIIKIEEPTYQTAYEYKPEILDEAEKRYLRGVIRPFRDKVKTIGKKYNKMNGKDNEYLTIILKEEPNMDFPNFEPNTMYKGMKIGKQYTLEELGL